MNSIFSYNVLRKYGLVVRFIIIFCFLTNIFLPNQHIKAKTQLAENATSELLYAVADSFRFPLNGQWKVILDFGGTNPRFTGKHLGEDASAAAETPLYAVANGVVRENYTHNAYMHVVIIEHTLSDGSKVTSVYGHMKGDGIIPVGTEVVKGQLIGYLDTLASFQANNYSPHEHFGIRKGGYSSTWVYYGYELGSETMANWHDPSDFINSHQGGSGSCSAPTNGIPRDSNTLNSQRVSFSWSPPSCEGIDYYTFRVANHSNIDNGPWIIDHGVSKDAVSTTEDIPSSYNGQTLYWAIWPHNSAGYGTKGGPWTFKIDTSTPPPPPPLPTGDWNIQYFRNKELTDQCSSSSFNSAFIFSDWGEGAPASGCNSDNWGARFTRRINFQGGNYTFALEADDWGRIYVDGNLFVDKWNGASQHYEGHYVSPGDHDVKIEFADTMGGAKISAWWWGPGFNIPHEDQDTNQWYANYWINQDQWWDSFAKVNEGTGQLFHQYDYGSPGWDMPDDHFSASFQRQAYFECGTYRFNMDHDDGAKFTLDGDLKVNRWTGDIGAYSIDLPVTQGLHLVKIDYYENGGAAHISFNWQKLNGCAPSAPILTAPSNNQTLDWNSVLAFRWNSSAGATKYFVNLQGGPGVNQDSGWLNTNEWDFGTLWPGDYTWTVTAANDSGSSPTASASFSISEPPHQPPLADFSAEPLTGSAPLSVTFTNLSTGDISSCTWAYGDGQTGSSCIGTNTHTYSSGGNYTVSLTVSGPAGSHSATRTGYITVNASIPNDEINQAIQVGTLPYSNLQSITGATTASDDPLLPCTGNQKYKTVWYRFTAPSNGMLMVDTFDSDYDTVLALWTGQRGSLVQIPNGCNDDSQINSQSEVIVPVTTNTVYYIEIASYYDVAGGQLGLHVKLDIPPAQFLKVSPENGSTGQSRNVNLQWGSSQGATQYEYCYDIVDNDSCESDWASVGTATSILLDNLAGNTTYFWQVRGVNSGGTTYANTNTWWTFTTMSDDTTSPNLSWVAPVEDSQVYDVFNQTIQLEVEASDASGINRVEFSRWDYVNLVNVPIGTVSSPPYRVSLDTSILPPEWNEIDVWAYDNAGNSTKKYIWLNKVDPAFSKTIPNNAATEMSTNPILSWEVSSGATGYEYCYDATNDNTCANWTSVGTNTTIDLSGLSSGTTYYWQVRAINSGGFTFANGSANAFWSFRTGNLPDSFAKASPTNTASGVSTSSVLSWGVSSGATSYEYCYDTSNDNACSTWISNSTSTSVTLDGLSQNTTYYWHVRARNGFGTTYANGTATSFWSFTTGGQPGAFNKSTPSNGSTGISTSQTLTWGTSAGATSYEYCYDTTNDNTCSSWISNGTATSKALSGLSNNTTYYWHVRAVNSIGTTYANGLTTSFWSFMTGSQPAAFNKSAPANGSTGVSISPTLGWGNSSGVVSYEYCYDTTNDSSCNNWTGNGTNTSITLSGLSTNTTYYWHVRAVNTFGTTYANGSTTAFWTFSTGNQPGAFGKTAPTNGSANVSINPTISWGSSTGATGYEYCYDTSNDNACANWTSNGANTSIMLSGLALNTTYYWHVRANNTFGTTFSNGTNTGFWSFTTGNIPGVFAKTSPTNGATGVSTSPTINWSTSNGATNYEYCYDTTNDNACTTWIGNGSNTSVTLSGLSTNTPYYWHVRAGNTFGTTYANGTATTFWSFTTVPNTGGTVLALNPQTNSIASGQNFNVTVEVRAGTQQVDGACAYLNFNSTYFSVVNITPGTTLSNILVNNYEPAGQVNYCAGTISNFPTGTFTLATVTFHAKAVTPSTPLAFNLTSPRQSDVTYGGNSVLGSTINGTVEISNTATLNGSVTLQGRPNAPHARWVVPLTVTLTVPGNPQSAYTFTPTTDTNGRFSATGIMPGTYDVRVKHSHTLRNVKQVTLVNGDNTVDFGTLLEGDARNDNDVSLTDFSVLASTYGKCQDVTGYDERADFNSDTCIDLLDFSWLATNFGETGDNAVTNSISPEELEDLLAPVSIFVDPPQSKVMVGDTFTVAIKVEAGSQLVDGAQASLDFDPTKLRVKSIQGNSAAFPNVLLNTYNNTTGTIDYAAGALSNFPSGTITLVSIEFEAIGQSPATPLTFHYGQPLRNTIVTYGGASVLTGDQDGKVQTEYENKLFLPVVVR